MNRPTPGRRKNRKWMEREFFDVLWCSCHVLWCFFFKIRCSVFVKQPALVSAHSTWLQNWIELNWKVVPRNLTTFLKSCLSRHPSACIGDPNLSDLSDPATPNWIQTSKSSWNGMTAGHSRRCGNCLQGEAPWIAELTSNLFNVG
jgi:hypothetical protein